MRTDLKGPSSCHHNPKLQSCLEAGQRGHAERGSADAGTGFQPWTVWQQHVYASWPPCDGLLDTIQMAGHMKSPHSRTASLLNGVCLQDCGCGNALAEGEQPMLGASKNDLRSHPCLFHLGDAAQYFKEPGSQPCCFILCPGARFLITVIWR